MNYVKKIVGDFESHDFEKMLDDLSSKFNVMYVDGNLFIALKHWSDFEGSEELVEKVFQPVRDFWIEEIAGKNLDKQAEFVKDWCIKNSVRVEEERYEEENQEVLKRAWLAMDNLENELKKMADEALKKGKEEPSGD